MILFNYSLLITHFPLLPFSIDFCYAFYYGFAGIRRTKLNSHLENCTLEHEVKLSKQFKFTLTIYILINVFCVVIGIQWMD